MSNDDMVENLVTRKILTDKREYFIFYHKRTGRFLGAPFKWWSAEFGERTKTGPPKTDFIFDLRSSMLQAWDRLLAKLETGESLTTDEACKACDLDCFLAAILPVEEFQAHEIATEEARGFAYYAACLEKRFPAFQGRLYRPSTPQENELAGAYLRSCAIQIRLLGPERKDPIETLRQMPRTRS